MDIEDMRLVTVVDWLFLLDAVQCVEEGQTAAMLQGGTTLQQLRIKKARSKLRDGRRKNLVIEKKSRNLSGGDKTDDGQNLRALFYEILSV